MGGLNLEPRLDRGQVGENVDIIEGVVRVCLIPLVRITLFQIFMAHFTFSRSKLTDHGGGGGGGSGRYSSWQVWWWCSTNSRLPSSSHLHSPTSMAQDLLPRSRYTLTFQNACRDYLICTISADCITLPNST